MSETLATVLTVDCRSHSKTDKNIDIKLSVKTQKYLPTYRC